MTSLVLLLNVKPATALEALIDVANESQHDALLEYLKSAPTVTTTDTIESVLIRCMGCGVTRPMCEL